MFCSREESSVARANALCTSVFIVSSDSDLTPADSVDSERRHHHPRERVQERGDGEDCAQLRDALRYDEHSRPHCSAIASAIPCSVRLRSFHRSGPGDA